MGNGRQSSSSRSPKKVDKSPFQFAAFNVLCAAVILGLFAAPLALSDDVFLYTVGGVEYSLGAQGYTANGVQAIIRPAFDYPVPVGWPAPIAGLPKLLVAHLAVVSLLGLFIVVFISSAVTLFRKEGSANRSTSSPYKAIRKVSHHMGGLGWATIMLILLVWGLLAADVVIVIQCYTAARGVVGTAEGFKLLPLGWAMIIVSGLFSIAWGAAVVVAKYKTRKQKLYSSSGSSSRR